LYFSKRNLVIGFGDRRLGNENADDQNANDQNSGGQKFGHPKDKTDALSPLPCMDSSRNYCRLDRQRDALTNLDFPK